MPPALKFLLPLHKPLIQLARLLLLRRVIRVLPVSLFHLAIPRHCRRRPRPEISTPCISSSSSRECFFPAATFSPGKNHCRRDIDNGDDVEKPFSSSNRGRDGSAKKLNRPGDNSDDAAASWSHCAPWRLRLALIPIHVGNVEHEEPTRTIHHFARFLSS